jgi:hypothetical protein|tara:strand:- start:469 stop:642 length:174 start_codon:yes stop_codon:yes gene_type:complete
LLIKPLLPIKKLFDSVVEKRKLKEEIKTLVKSSNKRNELIINLNPNNVITKANGIER